MNVKICLIHNLMIKSMSHWFSILIKFRLWLKLSNFSFNFICCWLNCWLKYQKCLFKLKHSRGHLDQLESDCLVTQRSGFNSATAKVRRVFFCARGKNYAQPQFLKSLLSLHIKVDQAITWTKRGLNNLDWVKGM